MRARVGLSAPKLIAEILNTDANRPGAIRSADADAEFLVGMRLRRDRMMHPFIALAIDILLGAERPLVEHHLRALIDHSAGIAAERMPSFSLSKKYCRISGLFSSSRKRRCAEIG